MVENLPPNSLVKKIPWRRKWQPSPVFLPEKFHGQRSLAGYSPWCCKKVGRDLVIKQQKHQQLFFKKKKRKITRWWQQITKPSGKPIWAWGPVCLHRSHAQEQDVGGQLLLSVVPDLLVRFWRSVGCNERVPGKSSFYNNFVFLWQRVNPPQFEKHCCDNSKLWKKEETVGLVES